MRPRQHVVTVLVAMVTAAVTAGGPAIAHGVEHALFAHAAGRVDGKDAVGAAATINSRKGKLVATNTKGRLPNNIIARAPNANRLDGKDITELTINGYEQVHNQTAFDSTAHKVINVYCPEGKRAVGGGFHAFASLGDPDRDTAPLAVRSSEPLPNPEGWSVIADETATYSHSWWLRAWVICVS